MTCRNPKEMEVTLSAFQIIERIVSKSGSSGRIYVPKEWVGKKVKIALVEDSEGNEHGQ